MREFDAAAGSTGACTRTRRAAASRDELECVPYARVRRPRASQRSASGSGFLDAGDTPACAASSRPRAIVVGRHAERASTAIMAATRAARIHSDRRAASRVARARRRVSASSTTAAWRSKCCGSRHGMKRVAYVDIDAHHGDGVFYAFEDDPDLLFADLHEDGRYPLSRHRHGRRKPASAPADGTKLNLPMPPGAERRAFPRGVARRSRTTCARRQPDFILLQCGADSLEGDPITHLRFSEDAHAHAAAPAVRDRRRARPRPRARHGRRRL